MKVLKQSKYFIFLTLALSTIISVSACSLAIPDTVFISNIELTDNPNEVLIKISDADYNKWDLIYDIQSLEMRKPSNSMNGTNLEVKASELFFDSQLISNGSDVFWKLTNLQDQSDYEFKLTVNETISIDPVSEYLFFVSNSLKTAYLILPYDVDTSDRIKDSVVYATIIIAPLDSPESIKFSYVAHSYLTSFFPTSFKVYDDLQLFYLPGAGADCVNSVYFSYDQDSFQFLLQTNAWQRDLLDPRIDKLITSSYDYQSGVSEIKLYDLNNFEESTFVISDDQIVALLDIVIIKNTSSVPSISTSKASNSSKLTESISTTLPTFGIYLPLGFAVSIILTRTKLRNSNQ